MRHFLMLLLHAAALFGLPAALFVTVPLHIILVSSERRKGVPTPETHVRCPDCRELVRKDARKCMHCGTGLIPQE